MVNRVERRPDGWYDIEEDLFVPMLWDIYGAGGFGARALPSEFRQLQRRIADVERRGA